MIAYTATMATMASRTNLWYLYNGKNVQKKMFPEEHHEKKWLLKQTMTRVGCFCHWHANWKWVQNHHSTCDPNVSEADTNKLQVRFHWSSSNTHGAHNGSRLNLGTGGSMPQRHISDLIPALLRQLRQLHVSVVTSQRPQQRWHLFQPAMRCHALPCGAMWPAFPWKCPQHLFTASLPRFYLNS